MSHLLWKYYLEDDVDGFRHLLETAAYNVRNVAQKRGGQAQNITASSGAAFSTSPGHPSSSPLLSPRLRKPSTQALTPASQSAVHAGITLTRTDINWRDSNGLTILHHAASSSSENAISFAQALLEHPLVDLYLQDLENGWTALHRAFYFGNITIARAILDRDADNSFGRTVGTKAHGVLGLVKIKDREGHGPLDLYAATIQDRTLHPEVIRRPRADSNADSEPDIAGPETDQEAIGAGFKDVKCDECFTFGTNRNVTLGFGDGDDRQWPERITLRRPEHLLQRFFREHMEHVGNNGSLTESSILDSTHPDATKQTVAPDAMPWVVRARPIRIQDVCMSKLHTAVLTDDPESNLHVCGHGPGGRLGLGHEKTQFTFTCVEGGALSGKKVASVALGQNHTLAISETGEIFSWGSNAFGQLGYTLPRTGLKDDEPVQLLPRQIFGPLKREAIQGLAASRIHSVAFTGSSLYTWGKNDGQLGLVDSDARSLESQTTPRKVAASLFSTPIAAVSAIDRATICLLSGSHDCWVFANFGYAKVQFPLDSFSNYFLSEKTTNFWTPKVDDWGNHVINVTSGGDTICALSSNGEVYSLSVSQPQGSPSAGASTTNPGKIKAALSSPQRIWSLKKNNMAARDVGVDADGSIIITTEEGSVWKRSRRAKIKDATASGATEYKPKDYKFSRVSGLTRVIGVRASSYGAYAAIRRDCDVTKTQIAVENSGLWSDTLSLLSFSSFTSAAITPDSESENPEPRLWRAKTTDPLAILKKNLLQSKDIETELCQHFFGRTDSVADGYDLVISTTVSDLRIPAHHTVLSARSRILRDELATAVETGHPVETELFKITPGKASTTVIFPGLDPLALMNFVLYCYTDDFLDYWHYASRVPKMAHRYRTIRTEMMKLASGLAMRKLEASVRQMITPTKCMAEDFEIAFQDPVYFDNADILVELADEEIPVHSSIVCQRCPFFEGMFLGRAGGRWLDARRDPSGADAMVRIDLKHVESRVFKLVVRHIYADTGEDLFDQVVSEDLEDFFDFLMEVLSVANELMLDRLAQICQQVMGRYVNVRNVCSLLNAVAPSAVSEFKDASLEYMCLSLEAMLHSSLLDELDEDLILELDEVVRSNQLACLPFARSGRAEALLLEAHPELADSMDRNRQAKLDAIAIHSKHQDLGHGMVGSFRAHSLEEDFASPSQQKSRRRSKANVSSKQSPAFKGKEAATFDEAIGLDLDLGSPALPMREEGRTRSYDAMGSSPKPDVWYDSKGKALSPPPSSPLVHSSRVPGQPSPSLRPSSSPQPSPGAAPWTSSPASVKKLDLKDIMSQASSSRVSSLSAGLAASKVQAEMRAPLASTGKLSQKERKKLQQQPFSGDTEERGAGPASSSLTASARGTPPPKGSPWQVVGSAGKTSSVKESSQRETRPPLTTASQARTPSTPQLTMRQTIAHPRPSSSAPKVAPPPPPSPLPHSVQYSPRPVQPVVEQSSMAAILYQQQEEKDSAARARDEAARRGLDEIQAEQAFQQWWDSEEKRIKAEAEQQARKSRGGGGRRGNKPKAGEESKATPRPHAVGPSKGRRGKKADAAPTAGAKQ